MSAETNGGVTPAAELSPLKRAFLAIDRLQARVRELEEGRRDPIAVVGIGCRFPGGASTPEQYAKLLRDGVDAVVPKPPVPRPGLEDDAGFPPAGYLQEDVAAFDPMFFGTAPREAASMDPQQRLVLECAWEALEDAGINPRSLEGSRSGVFVGVAASDWAQIQLRGVPTPDVVHSHFAAGVGHSMVSGRLSYVLGLQGPSVSLDTACSSSLVALHLACQSLRTKECDLALAGGVNLILAPDFTIAFQQTRMLSEDGRCRTFDAGATGFSRGEGCGVVVLKRLSDAERDGDRVLAVIRGSAVNQDGPSSGLTAPNGPAQEAVIRAALAAAGVAPASVGYVEAHGTGTELGDPIEAQALGAVYAEGRDPAQPLVIGSVKTNLGHLEAAAGVAGFIKAVLTVRDGIIPAQLHFRTPNPHIPWDRLPLAVATSARPFAGAGPRRAGVSSFGFSGTNVHIIVEEPPPAPAPVAAATPDRSVHVLPLSATSPDALRHAARGVAEVLADPATSLADVCHTAGVGRAPLRERLAVVGSSARQVRERLIGWLAGNDDAAVLRGQAPPEPARVAFLYTGQGSQKPGMGRALYETEPVVREVLDRADAILTPELGQPLLPLLFGTNDDPEALHRTVFAQPALVAMELAVSALWRSWGVRPERVMGHSVGEYAAAVDAGVMSLEDGLRLIAARGRLMQALPAGGAMVALFAGPDRVEPLLAAHGDAVSIAAVNAADSTVISGDEAAVESIAAKLLAEGVQHRRLVVSHAFHSRRMEPMLDAFRQVASTIRFSAPRIPLISNVTGAPITSSDATDPDYWCRHVRSAVRFGDGVLALHRAGIGVMLECGPDATLAGMASRSLQPGQAVAIPTLRQGREEQQAIAEAVAALHASGVSLDWLSRDRGRGRRRIALPVSTYARSRHWFTLGTGAAVAAPAGPAWQSASHPMLGTGIRTADGARVFDNPMSATTVPFVADHRVNGRVIMPATGHLEMLLAAARAAYGWSHPAIEDVTIREALVLAPDESRSVQVRIERPSNDRCRATIHSLGAADEEFHLHAEATIVREPLADAALPLDEQAVASRCPEVVEAAEFYAALAQRGLDFGPAFTGVVRVRRTDGEALAVLAPPDGLDETSYGLHPAMLDAGIQAISAALPGGITSSALYLPMGVQRVRTYPGAGSPRRSHVKLDNVQRDAAAISGTVVLYDDAGRLAASVEGIQMARVRTQDATAGASWNYRVTWETRERGAGTALVGTDSLIAAAERALAAFGQETGAAAYAGLAADLESLSADYFLRALYELGWMPQRGDVVTVEHLLTQCAIQPRYRALVRRMLRVLEGAGMVRASGEAWEVLAVPAAPSPRERAATLIERHRPHDAELIVTARCGDGLTGALRGTTDPLELLFPGGDTTAQGRIYRDTPIAKSFNGAIRDLVRDVQSGWKADRPLRILEIGGGTGGTTAHVLGVLDPARVEYTFTDIGRLFVNRARDAFGSHAFMRFATLDIDRDPLEQGFAAGGYDLVIASNVLHATRDLRTTLGRVRSLLSAEGLLCLFEVTNQRAWVDLTVGLTDGWWLFEDTDLRTENPVLTREQWTTLLNRAGFREASATAEPERDTGLAGQSIIVARRAADAASADRRWAIVCDGAAAAREFEARLRSEGASPHVITQISGQLPPNLTDIAVFLPLGGTRDGTSSEPERLRADLGGLLQLVQKLLRAEGPPPRLQLVTSGAQAASGDLESLDPVQAAVWGFARSIRLEHPELHCRCVDLDPESVSWTDAVHEELTQPDDEAEVAFRRGERRVARLASLALPARPQEPARLRYRASGLLEDLHFVPWPRRAPEAHEIEIAIEAAGMNFRDVVHALGVRADVEALGAECVGRVVAVGSGVTSLREGDLVLAAAGAFGDYVTMAADLAVPVPSSLSIPEAATLPIAFLTAHRALHVVAGVRPGQRVLVHAGAGGVGMAAVQLAVAAGADVYATAGTPAKRALVRELGAREVFDSRSVSFADDVLRATQGAGVDIVLNSLAGEFIPASVRVLAEGGMLVELGKTGGWDDERARAVPGARERIRYVPVDLSDDLLHHPETIQPALRELVERVAAGELKPLPYRVFPLSRAEDAFRLMAAGRHTGKLILVPDDRLPVRGDGSYLVTGGLAGLGLRVAEHLVERGARSVILNGRSAPRADAQAAIDRMRGHGACVTVIQADVAEDGALERALATATGLPPIRGVVHSAGTLRDAAIMQQSWDDVLEVLRPKAMGLRQVERATRTAPLDFFIVFSSMAGTLGSPGQANHAAANAFLDAAVIDRAAHGRTGVSLAWGAWGEIGAAVRHGVNTRAARKGIGIIDPETGIRLMERVSSAGHAAVMISPIAWEAFLPESGVQPFFERVAHLRRRVAAVPVRREASVESGKATRSLAEEIAAVPPGRRRALLQERIRGCARRVLGLPSTHDLDERQPLGDLGLDSLMAVELRNALGALVARSLPATLLFDHPTVGALTTYLAPGLLGEEAAPVRPPETVSTPASIGRGELDAMLDRIEALSDDEVKSRVNGVQEKSRV